MKKIFKKIKKNSETKERHKIEESEEKKDEEEKTSTEEIEEISKNQKKIKNKIEDEEFINLRHICNVGFAILKYLYGKVGKA